MDPKLQGTRHLVRRASRWCQDTGVGGRPSWRGSRRTRPTSLVGWTRTNGLGKVSPRGQVAPRWSRNPPGQFLVWSEMLSREPCRGDPLQCWGSRVTFQSQAGAAGRKALGRLGRAFAEGEPRLGWALTSPHPLAPCFSFHFVCPQP